MTATEGGIRSPLLRMVQSDAASGPSPAATSSLLERLIGEQQTLTAVESFSHKHETGQIPAKARYYHDLIPASAPGPGQQYAFEVDLDACTGCKACVSACHSLNGLDEHEVWRSVGTLQGGTTETPYQQPVTTSCHHCVDPACLSGCPVKAYDKDPVTGIVRHLDDQCIGCQYCTLMCPYDAPKYNAALGIVRKCDMCSHRLSAAEAPACVQACPNQAIRVQIVEQKQSIQAADAGAFLPGAARPEDTVPTTTYRTNRHVPQNALPVDFYRVSPEHGHPPLVIMLVLTQLAAGAFAANALAHGLDADLFAAAGPTAPILAMAFAFVALGASMLHLGRPLYAFRAILGLRTSWLSREILTFGLFAGAGLAYGLHALLDRSEWVHLPAWLGHAAPLLEATATGAGLAGVACSVMVYGATRRAYWAPARTALRFLGTTTILGSAALILTAVATAAVTPRAIPLVTRLIPFLVATTVTTSIIKMLWEASAFLHLRDRQTTTLRRVAVLMSQDLRRLTGFRFAAGFIGGVLLPCVLWVHLRDAAVQPTPTSIATAAAILTLVLVGELLERFLFFRAAPPSRMPGSLA